MFKFRDIFFFFIVINEQGTRALLGVCYIPVRRSVRLVLHGTRIPLILTDIYSIRHQIIEFFYILFRWWISIASVGDFEGLTFGVYLANIPIYAILIQLQGRQTTTTEVRLRIFWRKISTLLPIFCFKYEARNILIQILQISSRLSGSPVSATATVFRPGGRSIRLLLF